MDNEEKCNMVLEWAENMPDFDTEFVESLLEQLGERELTEAQEDGLNNIIERFRIR